MGLGWYWNLRKSEDYQLTTGLNAFGIWYQKNLMNFTYGQGGYFSPQQYYALMVPLTWAQRQDRFSYLVRGALGVQTYTTNDSSLFPTDSNLQAGANDAMSIAVARGLVAPGTTATYAGQTVTNMAYNLAAAGEYQVAPQLFLGGSAELNNASNYRQWGAGLYLRFSFYPINRPMAIPVSPYTSPYGQ